MPLSSHVATQPGIPKPGKPPQDLHRTTGNDHRRPHRTACAPHTHTRPTGCHHRALSPEWRPRGPKRAQDAPQAKLGPSTGQPQGQSPHRAPQDDRQGTQERPQDPTGRSTGRPQDPTGRPQDPTGRPQDPTGRGTGRPQDPTGGHRTGHRAAHEPPQGRYRQSQAGPHDTTGSPTGDTKGHPEDRRRGHCPQGTGPKPHGGMATRAPISPPEQSANRRFPVRVGGGRPVPVPHKQISGCALPCGHGRPRAPRGIT